MRDVANEQKKTMRRNEECDRLQLLFQRRQTKRGTNTRNSEIDDKHARVFIVHIAHSSLFLFRVYIVRTCNVCICVDSI